jgi:hypothetical protein
MLVPSTKFIVGRDWGFKRGTKRSTCRDEGPRPQNNLGLQDQSSSGGTREPKRKVYMISRHRSIVVPLALCALLLGLSRTSMAQIGGVSGQIGASKSEIVGVEIGIAAAGAAIGVGIYYTVRHSHSVTGCTVSGPGGLQLRSQGNQQNYVLIGDVATVKQGERIRVSGKKKRQGSGAPQELTKDYGACSVSQ